MDSLAGIVALGVVFVALIVATVYVAFQFGICPLFIALNGAEFVVAGIFGTVLGDYLGRRA